MPTPSSNIDFTLDNTELLNFNAADISKLLTQKLLQNNNFSDAVYPGSNLSNIVDNISLGFGLLLWTLNQNLNESSHSESQIYENMNRIVKELSYNPLGYQSPVVPFQLTITGLDPAAYLLPRYSFVISNTGITYSLKEDVVFTASTSGTEVLTDVSKKHLLYQGKYVEYPIYISTGTQNESITLSVHSNVIVDHFSIDVYVKSVIDNKWEKWTETTSLYINNPNDKVYEIRLDENKKYGIKFGNNISGKQLTSGDQVAIYYLRSDGTDKEVKTNDIDGAVYRYDTLQLRDILAEINLVDYIIVNGLLSKQNLNVINNSSSTYFSEPESVDSIRNRSVTNYKSQLRVITKEDYETFALNNFSNIIHSVSVVNNDDYVNSYLKYFYDMGFSNPHLEERTLYNQINYSNNCNFNNIYLFVVDKIDDTFYLPDALKTLIKSKFEDIKTLNTNLIVSDPLYVGYNFGSVSNNQNNNLRVIRKKNSSASPQSIKQKIIDIISKYFELSNCQLGQVVDVQEISKRILAIDGISKLETFDYESEEISDGIHLVSVSNPYNDTKTHIQGSQTLQYFQFPFWDSINIGEQIVIV